MKDHERAQLESCVNNARNLCMELETLANEIAGRGKVAFRFDELLAKAKNLRNELVDIQRDNS